MKFLKTCLRIAGVIALSGALLFGWHLLENRGVSAPAEILFPGTANDADCCILLSGDSCVLIDTGESIDGERIWQALQSRGVDRIDCLILSHPDQDHVGGAAYLLEKLPIQQVISPYFEGEKQEYNMLLNLLEERKIPYVTLAKDRHFRFGELEMRIFPPEELHYGKSNNYSLAVLAEHGDVTLFFAGDAEEKRLEEIARLNPPENVTLYKVAHHGRYSLGGEELISRLSPEIAVICAAEAEEEIRLALVTEGSQIYNTIDMECSFVSDGKSLKTVVK